MATHREKTGSLFCQSIEQLLQSLHEFAGAKDHHRTLVGNAPKYFVHQRVGSLHLFGLSKFCAFQNITIASYLGHYRKRVNGGITQDHIKRLTGQLWRPYSKVGLEIQEAFDQWIHAFFPAYHVSKASFLTVDQIHGPELPQKAPEMTPEELIKQLQWQVELGKVGELIALSYERQRLNQMEIKHAEVKDVFNTNVRAGFDISSHSGNEDRFIEVKSSSEKHRPFFLSANEYQVLKELKGQAYLYLVHVENIIEQTGTVYKTIQDPIGMLEEKNFHPVVYQVTVTA